ncbi:replication initiation protein [Chromohalobacter sp. 48-RD10]|uniref:replication initiation protein n=1 Tax=Chromohalobacter sp. 48-RD10 TaxID=2994063 RepID=UPI002469690E|nr:replication initiation protein [Chromohalobacter sp. 48-RD10]
MNKSKDLRVYKANAVVEASYDLSVAEHRLLLACFAQIGQEATDERLYRVYARDIAELTDIPTPDAYRDAAVATERLYERSVEVFEGPNGTAPPKKRKFRWIQEAVYAEGEGYVDVRLSTSILPYVNNLLEQYTVYHMQDVARMTSRYAIRVYELLVQWRRRGSREVEVEWLRRTLGVGDKYPNFKDFRRWVLEQAVSQINERSPLHVDWKPRKTGRKVTHIEFTFTDEREVKRLEEKKRREEEAQRRQKEAKKARQGAAKTGSGALYGIPRATIEAQAQPGESYEDAALRLLEESRQG